MTDDWSLQLPDVKPMTPTPETLRSVFVRWSASNRMTLDDVRLETLAAADAWEAKVRENEALREAARAYLDATVEGTATVGHQKRLDSAIRGVA